MGPDGTLTEEEIKKIEQELKIQTIIPGANSQGYKEYSTEIYKFFNKPEWDEHLNDIDALKDAQKTTSGEVKSYIDYRISVLEEFERRGKIAHDSSNLSKLVKKYKYLPSYSIEIPFVGTAEYENVNIINGISYKKQNRGMSCWSEALSGLLSSRGLEMPSEMLRAYKTDISTSHKDDAKSVYDHAPLVHKLLPNTGMKLRKFMVGTSKDELVDNLKNVVVTAVLDNNSPVAITNGNHYITIIGTGVSKVDGQEGIFYLDSNDDPPSPSFMTYEDYVVNRALGNPNLNNAAGSLFECAWLEDYTVKLDANNKKECVNLKANDLEKAGIVKYNPNNDKIDIIINENENKQGYKLSLDAENGINKVTYEHKDSSGKTAYIDEVAIPVSLNTKYLDPQINKTIPPVSNSNDNQREEEKNRESNPTADEIAYDAALEFVAEMFGENENSNVVGEQANPASTESTPVATTMAESTPATTGEATATTSTATAENTESLATNNEKEPVNPVDYAGETYSDYVKLLESSLASNPFFEGYEFDLKIDSNGKVEKGNAFYESFKDTPFSKQVQNSIRQLTDVKKLIKKYKADIKDGKVADMDELDKQLLEGLNNSNTNIKEYLNNANDRTTQGYIKALSLSTSIDNALAVRNMANEKSKDNYDNVIKDASNNILPHYQQIFRLRNKVSDTITILNKKNSPEYDNAANALSDVLDFVMPEYHDDSRSGNKAINDNLMADDNFKRKLRKLKETSEAYVKHATIDDKGNPKEPSSTIGKERLLAFSQLINYTDNMLDMIDLREKIEALPVNKEAAEQEKAEREALEQQKAEEEKLIRESNLKAVEEEEAKEKAKKEKAENKKSENKAAKKSLKDMQKDPVALGHKKVFDINSQTYEKPAKSASSGRGVIIARSAIRFLKKRYIDVKYGLRVGYHYTKTGISNLFRRARQQEEANVNVVSDETIRRAEEELQRRNLPKALGGERTDDVVVIEDSENYKIRYVREADGSDGASKDEEEDDFVISGLDDVKDSPDLNKSIDMNKTLNEEQIKDILEDGNIHTGEAADDNVIKIVDSKNSQLVADAKKKEGIFKRAGKGIMKGINFTGSKIGSGLKYLGDTKFGEKCKKGFGYLGGQLVRAKDYLADKWDEVWLADMQTTVYANEREERLINLTDARRAATLDVIRDNITAKNITLVKNQNLMKSIAKNIQIRANKDRIREQANNKDGAGLGSVELRDLNEEGKEIDKEKVGAGFTQNVGESNLGRAAIYDEENKTKSEKIGLNALLDEEKAEKEKKSNLDENLAKNKKLIEELEGKDEKLIECSFKTFIDLGKKMATQGKVSGSQAKLLGTILNLSRAYNNHIDPKGNHGDPIEGLLGLDFEKGGTSAFKWSFFAQNVLECVDVLNKFTDGELKAMDIYQLGDMGTRAYLTVRNTLYPDVPVGKEALLGLTTIDCLRGIAKGCSTIRDDKAVINNIREFQNSEDGMKLMEKKSEDWNFTRMIKDSTESRIQGLKREMLGAGLDIGFNSCLMISSFLAAPGGNINSFVVDRLGLSMNVAKPLVDYVKKNFWDDKTLYYNDIFGGKENYDKICKEMDIKPEDLDREVLKATNMADIHELADYARAEHAMQLASNNNSELNLNTIDYMQKAGYTKPDDKTAPTKEAINEKVGGRTKIKNLIKKERDIAGYGLY